MTRRILVIAHPSRTGSLEARDAAAEALRSFGVDAVIEHDPSDGDVEAALVLGGDGTMLHAAHVTRGTGIPLLGVNLGRVGFLAEIERDGVLEAAECLAGRTYHVEERGTLDWSVVADGEELHRDWALNEVTIERRNPLRTLEVCVAVDATVMSAFGCDGVVVSTPTGSTAHAFSAGGPVVWPDVEALLLVPLAAHALFARPLVVGPDTMFAIQVQGNSSSAGIAVADGARTVDVPLGATVQVSLSSHVVRLARKSDDTFTDRLIDKFDLPTDGWRGERAHPSREE